MSKIAYILLFILLVIPGCAHDPWTKEQIALQSAATAFTVVDWGQTLDIAKKPNEYIETNPVLGKHPSEGRVNTYFAIATLGQIAIAHILPDKWRKRWLGANIMVEGYFVQGNYKLGLRVNF